MLASFKNQLKKQGNKNFNFVKVRAARVCSHCLQTITAGTECLTVNPKRGTRRWYCCKCVELRLNIIQAKAHLDSVAFDDEGGYMAYYDWLSECEDAFEEARG